jgi:hypothetical protein
MLQKLAEARGIIKSSKLKKAGRNKFSEYDYFTPEQINQLVFEAEKSTGLIHLFSMARNENGLHGHLDIIEIETGEKITLLQATDIPLIKATNVAQQIGGAVTYTLRYMLMTAFDISDNSMDFDSHDGNISVGKNIIPDVRFNKLIQSIHASPDRAAEWLSLARKQFKFTDKQETILTEWEDAL